MGGWGEEGGTCGAGVVGEMSWEGGEGGMEDDPFGFVGWAWIDERGGGRVGVRRTSSKDKAHVDFVLDRGRISLLSSR